MREIFFQFQLFSSGSLSKVHVCCVLKKASPITFLNPLSVNHEIQYI